MFRVLIAFFIIPIAVITAYADMVGAMRSSLEHVEPLVYLFFLSLFTFIVWAKVTFIALYGLRCS